MMHAKQIIRAGQRRRSQLVASENGMVTMVVAAAMLVVMVLAGYLMQFSAGLAQQARLQNAADLAALGAASYHVQGYDDTQACAVARKIVADMPDKAALQCAVQGSDVRIAVTAKGFFTWLAPAVTAKAVAGPVE